MASILIGNSTAIILADVTDHLPTAGATLSGTRTDQIDLTSLAAAAFRQSDKVDFGATRAKQWLCRAAMEPAAAPTAGGTFDFYLAPSDSATAGNNNPGNVSGSDAAYVGYGAASTDADEAIDQLEYIGSFPVSADADIHIGEAGVFTPTLRYGSIVVRNSTDQALQTDAVEMSIHLIPILDQTA